MERKKNDVDVRQTTFHLSIEYLRMILPLRNVIISENEKGKEIIMMAILYSINKCC